MREYWRESSGENELEDMVASAIRMGRPGLSGGAASIVKLNLVEAAENFRRSTQHCDNLVTVHRERGRARQGFQGEEISINRAIVVLAVASWQVVIQDFTLACLDLSAPGPGSPLSAQSYAVLAGRVRREVGAFATPNAQNVRNLMLGAGFDPRPSWAWIGAGGHEGTTQWTPEKVDARIDDWLRVRHAIAHGRATLPLLRVLRAVRQYPNMKDPELRLDDAEQCLAFFRRLAGVTGKALASHLEVPAPFRGRRGVVVAADDPEAELTHEMDKVKQQYRAYTAAHKALKTAKTKAEREPLEAEKEANRKAFRQYVVAREKRRTLRKERGASVGA